MRDGGTVVTAVGSAVAGVGLVLTSKVAGQQQALVLVGEKDPANSFEHSTVHRVCVPLPVFRYLPNVLHGRPERQTSDGRGWHNYETCKYPSPPT